MFYDRFLDLCNKKGVKPSRVAVDTNFNKGSISVWKKKYEEGTDIKPTTEILNKIADYFDVSVDYLLGRNSDEMQFGIFDSKLKKARLNKGLTQMELAEKLGVTQIDIDKWESGKSQIDDKNLKKCAEFLDVTSDYLLGKTDERKPINHDITADDIKFALFGGDSEFINDESYEDVLAFAKIVAEKERRKRAQTNELN